MLSAQQRFAIADSRLPIRDSRFLTLVAHCSLLSTARSSVDFWLAHRIFNYARFLLGQTERPRNSLRLVDTNETMERRSRFVACHVALPIVGKGEAKTLAEDVFL